MHDIPTESDHFLRAVTELGDRQPVVASRDICSQTGIKLVAEGTRVNSSFLERLAQHKLMPPIEQCLAVENGVTVEKMAAEACALVDRSPHLRRLRAAFTMQTELRTAFGRIHINTPMAFKLTVAREQRPELYRHSLIMALICIYLGHRVGLDEQELSTLGAAAVLHDIGLMHIDPALTDRTRRLTDAEWRHIHSHPVIGHLILRHYPEYDGDIARAVLEHHERIDGSGYPAGLAGNKIGKYGQILAVGEVAASRLDENGQCEACGQMEVIIKLNAQKFDNKLMSALLAMFKPEGPEAPSTVDTGVGGIQQRLDSLAEIFAAWDKVDAARQGAVSGRPIAMLAGYVHDRLTSLHRALDDAGFSQGDICLITRGIEDDARGLSELDALSAEAIWQTRNIVREIRRRWPDYLTSNEPLAAIIRDWEARAEQALARIGTGPGESRT